MYKRQGGWCGFVGGCRRSGCGRGARHIPAPSLVFDDQALQHFAHDGLFIGRQLADRLELQAQLFAGFQSESAGAAALRGLQALGPAEGAAMGAIAAIQNLGNGAKTAEQTFEIMDGVLRSKAADLVGHSTIPAQILNVEGKVVSTQQIPISQLLSPKASINVSSGAKMDRFMETLKQTKAGSAPPPITVTPGANGTRISNVPLDPVGH